MGTTAETHFVDDRGRTCAVLWRAIDGHPKGYGAELQNLLGTFRFVDGLSGQRESGLIRLRTVDEPRIALGMPCLAAQAVALLKDDEAGYVFLQPPGYFDLPPAFRYTVCVDGTGVLSLRCEVPVLDTDLHGASAPGETVPHTWRVLYDGPASSFDPDDAERSAFE